MLQCGGIIEAAAGESRERWRRGLAAVLGEEQGSTEKLGSLEDSSSPRPDLPAQRDSAVPAMGERRSQFRHERGNKPPVRSREEETCQEAELQLSEDSTSAPVMEGSANRQGGQKRRAPAPPTAQTG